MIEVQKNIDNAYLTLKSAHDNEKLRPIVRYEIYSAQQNDKTFRLAYHESTDVKNFKKNVKDVLENFGSDIIQIKIYAGKKPDVITFKTTDTYIEFWEGKKPEPVQQKIDNNSDRDSDYKNGLGAIEQLRAEVITQKHENQIQFLKHEHDLNIRKLLDEIEKYKDEIYELKADLNEVEAENTQLVEAFEEIQADIESQPEDNSSETLKLKAIITGVGKIMGLKNDEINDLAGILDNNNTNKTETPAEEKGGGLMDENTTSDNANLSDTDRTKAGLVKWINSLNDKELVEALTWILTVISDEITKTKSADIVNDVIDFLSEKLNIQDTDDNETDGKEKTTKHETEEND
jgi:hypothetical protein